VKITAEAYVTVNLPNHQAVVSPPENDT